MLNITRKIGEKIIIGEDVVLEVMEVSGSSVRIGIRAPRSVPVYREEIWEAVRAENAAAAKSTPTKLPEPPKAGNQGTSPRPSVRTGVRTVPQQPTTPARTSVRAPDAS
ncbi:MAG: carbon storage regulator CsrA [Solirubrobacteraceae bacterium]|nr:carbon storage regulator CsrA [Solirubrobacteraceae bacterium]